MQNFIKINDNDNVIVALHTIPAGHKMEISDISEDVRCNLYEI